MDDVAAPACVVSPVASRLPALVGPMHGAGVAWLADDGIVEWRGADTPVKTLWILERRAGPVRITGRQLDGRGVATFQRDAGPPAAALVIDDPVTWSARPGGASAVDLRAHVFLPSSVFYPSAGCWEFTVRIGDAETRIVRQLD